MNNYFKFSWCGYIRLATTVGIGLPVLTVLTCFFVITHYFGYSAQSMPVMAMYLMMGFSVIITAAAFGLAYAYAPKGAMLGDTALTICRPLSPIVIPYSSITNVEPLTDEEMGCFFRHWGVRCAFGHYGLRSSEKLGHFMMYGTKYEDYVLVEADKKYVITPDNYIWFAEQLKQRIEKRPS